jgi:hypothetical protein
VSRKISRMRRLHIRGADQTTLVSYHICLDKLVDLSDSKHAQDMLRRENPSDQP